VELPVRAGGRLVQGRAIRSVGAGDAGGLTAPGFCVSAVGVEVEAVAAVGVEARRTSSSSLEGLEALSGHTRSGSSRTLNSGSTPPHP
jgi:hypothetical protein